MERQRQMRRCAEQKELTSRRLNELIAILKSCRYPKLLSQPILGDFEHTFNVLRSIEREFITMEQSKDPDSNQVSLFLSFSVPSLSLSLSLPFTSFSLCYSLFHIYTPLHTLSLSDRQTPGKSVWSSAQGG